MAIHFLDPNDEPGRECPGCPNCLGECQAFASSPGSFEWCSRAAPGTLPGNPDGATIKVDYYTEECAPHNAIGNSCGEGWYTERMASFRGPFPTEAAALEAARASYKGSK